jgi:hypothetical protein
MKAVFIVWLCVWGVTVRLCRSPNNNNYYYPQVNHICINSWWQLLW